MTGTGPNATPALLADIGGTNARFALQWRGQPPRHVEILRCADYASPAEAANTYLKQVGPSAPPDRGAFAIAGPVTGDEVRMTNHVWSFSITALQRALGLNTLDVVNDFTAMALAIPHLGADDLRPTGSGAPIPGAAKAVLGPGTGLGVSGLVPCGTGWAPIAGEGGHVTLAATTAREAEILDRLRAEIGHVSAERALSGPGLVNLYRTIRAQAGAADLLTPSDITGRAIAGNDPIAAETLHMFCAFLGTVAANLALTLGARGGVYIAGGIVPKLGAAFDASPFRSRFEQKGRYSDYLTQIPTYVVTAKTPALIGLAALADAKN